MYKREDYEAAAHVITERCGGERQIALVLGSGMGRLFEEASAVLPYSEIPHFPQPTAPAHRGELLATDKAFIMCGRFHRYEGYTPEELTFYVRALRLAGVRKLVLTNAAGAVSPALRPGDIALITDHINLSGENPLIGRNDESFGERFFDMSEAYSPKLRRKAEECAKRLGTELKRGVYFYMSGPSYETPAEVRAIAALGGDLVGMSTVFECIAARHCGMEVLGISCVTNMACGVGGTAVSADDVEKTAGESGERLRCLLTEIIKSI